MSRPGPRRPQVAFRISLEERASVDRWAQVAGINRSDMLRLMIAYALANMPQERPST